jgi:hypothetical protein
VLLNDLSSFDGLSLASSVPLWNKYSQILRVGWLGPQFVFPKGVVDGIVSDALWGLCINRSIQMRMSCGCYLCNTPHFQPLVTQHAGRCVTLIAGLITVPSSDGILFVAPNLIAHYVTSHGYLPPDQFVKAVASYCSP